MTFRRTSALAVIALLASACGGADSGAATTTTAPSAASTTLVTTTTVPDATTTTLDPRSLEGLLAGLDTDRSTPPTLEIDSPFGAADDLAAAAIGQELDSALGTSVSGLFDIKVFPILGSTEVLLIVRAATDIDLDDLPDDLFEALVDAPSADTAGVTMLVIVLADTDELGDFELTIAIPWSAARAALVEGADITDRVGIQITRDGQVVDG